MFINDTFLKVRSLGSTLSGNRAQSLLHLGGGEGDMRGVRLQLGCAWRWETVSDRARELKRHGVCWLAGRTRRVREVRDSRAWQVRQNKPAVTHELLHSPLWSDPAGQPTIWDGTTYSSNHLDYTQEQKRRGMVCVCSLRRRRCLNVTANESVGEEEEATTQLSLSDWKVILSKHKEELFLIL